MTNIFRKKTGKHSRPQEERLSRSHGDSYASANSPKQDLRIYICVSMCGGVRDGMGSLGVELLRKQFVVWDVCRIETRGPISGGYRARVSGRGGQWTSRATRVLSTGTGR